MKKGILLLFIALLILACGCSGKLLSITNASFESGLSGWETRIYSETGASVSAESDPSHGGVVFVSAKAKNDVRAVQELKVSPNTVYRITCEVRTEDVRGGVGANIGVYGIAVTSEPLTGTNDWTSIELVGRTADGQKTLPISVGIGGHGAVASGRAWFDNVRIEPAEDKGVINVLGSSSGSSAGNSGQNGQRTEFPTGEVLLTALISTAVFALFFAWHRLAAKKPLKLADEKKDGRGMMLLILFTALAVRIAVAVLALSLTQLGGHKTDVNCFASWGRRVLESGPAHFYDQWCDYPPGYMLILGGMAGISKLLGTGNAVYLVLIKLPSIIADLVCAYIVWRLAKKTMSRSAALALLCVAAFTPVVVYVSSYWGQIDQILALFLVLPILLLYKRRPIWAGLMYGVGIALKPQALMCGPLFVAACVMYIAMGDPYGNPFAGRHFHKLLGVKKDSAGFRTIEILIGIAAAFLVIILVSLPFKGEQETFWIIDKYLGTATSYKYATVNGYNFWALVGANWKSTEDPFLGLTYGKWGTIAMVVFIAAGIAMFVFASIKHKNAKGALPLSMAYTLAGIFTFGHYMHERYIFPALLLILIAYIFYNDRYLIWTYFAYAATILLNCLAAFWYSELYDLGLYWDKRLIFWCSLANVVIFVGFTVLTLFLIIGNKPKRGYNG